MHTQPQVQVADIALGLGRLGIKPGDVMMAHSSLSAFGWVEGGAEAVIKAALHAVGPAGTMVMPTLCQKAKERRFEVWDPATSPSDVGRITEVFRQWPGVVRSDHATHSVAAIGPQAEGITCGHAGAHGRPGPWGPAAFGHGCPWDALHGLDAWYVFLGVSFRVNTCRHYTQSLLVESALAGGAPAEGLRGWLTEGVWPDYDDEQMEATLAERGLLSYETIGQARCRAIRTRALVDSSLGILRAEPERWFSSEFNDWLQTGR